MARLLRRGWWVTIYYLSWIAFGSVGLVLNLACLLLLLAPRRAACARGARETIRRLFDFWLRWIHATRVVDIVWHGFDRPLPTGAVYIANHPTLVDATFLLARLPDAICIFKPALMRHPVIGPAAHMAGYVAGNSGVDLVREVAGRIAAGQSLLVFPEGTRTTPGTLLNPFKPGFALIAARAGAPVQAITIRPATELMPRGRPWWRPPATLPTRVDIALDRRWETDPTRSSADVSAEIEQHFRTVLSAPR